MKFSINKSELQYALSIVQKGISSRSTLPVLSGVLIDATDNQLIFQSTDLELSVQCSSAALIEEKGRTVLPGKLFSDIVKSLPDAAVHIDANDHEANITCDTSAFLVKTLDAADFPSFPTVEPSQQIKIPFDIFSLMVHRVAKSVSRDETRAILTGILIEIEGIHLRMVATDSYRLALSETNIDSDNYNDDNNFSVVISGNFLNDIASINQPASEISIGSTENQIVITCGDTIFINRRIEGTYPNYRQLLPDTYETRATFEMSSLLASTKRAALMSSSSSPIRFNLSPEVEYAEISVSSADTGSVKESINCPIEGTPVEIAFNSSYVIDGLSVIKDEKIYFETTSSLKPGIFRSIDSNEYLYLIMPVRI